MQDLKKNIIFNDNNDLFFIWDLALKFYPAIGCVIFQQIRRIILLLRPTLVNKTSHKFTGKLGQKMDKTKFGRNYKIILFK